MIKKSTGLSLTQKQKTRKEAGNATATARKKATKGTKLKQAEKTIAKKAMKKGNGSISTKISRTFSPKSKRKIVTLIAEGIEKEVKVTPSKKPKSQEIPTCKPIKWRIRK